MVSKKGIAKIVKKAKLSASNSTSDLLNIGDCFANANDVEDEPFHPTSQAHVRTSHDSKDDAARRQTKAHRKPKAIPKRRPNSSSLELPEKKKQKSLDTDDVTGWKSSPRKLSRDTRERVRKSIRDDDTRDELEGPKNSRNPMRKDVSASTTSIKSRKTPKHEPLTDERVAYLLAAAKPNQSFHAGAVDLGSIEAVDAEWSACNELYEILWRHHSGTFDTTCVYLPGLATYLTHLDDLHAIMEDLARFVTVNNTRAAVEAQLTGLIRLINQCKDVETLESDQAWLSQAKEHYRNIHERAKTEGNTAKVGLMNRLLQTLSIFSGATKARFDMLKSKLKNGTTGKDKGKKIGAIG